MRIFFCKSDQGCFVLTSPLSLSLFLEDVISPRFESFSEDQLFWTLQLTLVKLDVNEYGGLFKNERGSSFHKNLVKKF